MKQFALESRQKSVLFGLMGLGAVCLIWSYFSDPIDNGQHLRFWTNLLHNAAFFTGIAFTATFAIAATITAYAGWHTAFKRVWEAMSLFLPIGLIGILIVGVAGMSHVHGIYHWMDTEHVQDDKILKGKSAFLNVGFYLGAIAIGFVWWWFARKFRSLSLQQDESGNDTTYPWYKQMKVYGAIFLPIAGFTSAAAIWLWLMSIDAHWYSTMYAWYTTASWWVSAVSITILLLIYLKSKGYFEEVTIEHLHDLGKFLFAFSVFWTYLWFSQYMLIWYANIGEETIYFRQRMGEFPVLFYGNLLMNFVLPFLILIRNDTKRKFGTLGFVAALVLFGHWWDFFQMVKIGPYKSAQHTEQHATGHGAEGHAATTATMPNAAHNAGEHKADTSHQGHAEPAKGEHGKEEMITLHGGDKPADAHQEASHAPEQHGDSHGDAGHAEAALDDSPTAQLDALNKANYFHYASDMTAGYGIPGLLELGVFLGFGALFTFFVLTQLSKASLVPKNDPYLEETMHHQVEIHDAH